MKRQQRLLWGSLFIAVMGIVAFLAVLWNVVIMKNYYKFLDVARTFPFRQIKEEIESPWLNVILGSLGFGLLVALSIMFFLKLFKEMKINQIQSEFLARITHELKTPLASLSLTSSLLRSTQAKPSDHERLWKVHDIELNRLKHEIELLLEGSRWESGHTSAQLRILNVQDCLNSVLQRWQLLLPQEHSLLELTGIPLNCKAWIDQRLFDLALNNLLENARKFSKDAVRIHISTTITEGKNAQECRWEIAIRDEGIGFDPKLTNKLFSKFYRASHNSTKTIAGTGLGLSLVQSACKAMRFKVRAHSQGDGLGATFSISGRGFYT